MRAAFRRTSHLFTRPAETLRGYRLAELRPDLISGLTVAVVLLPQALVFSLLAGLPPERGLYTAIVAAIAGGLWGSSNHLHTGPTNTASILVFSTLLPIARPGTFEFIAAAGVLAVLAGIIRILMGVLRMGMLVNFVSDSVIVGFTAGAGALIVAGELRPFLGLRAGAGSGLIDTLSNVAVRLPETHLPSLALGCGALALILILRRLVKGLPSPLIVIALATLIVSVFHLDAQGVAVLGELPRGLPPLASLPLLNLDLLGHLATGSLAVAAIGLVEATSIARAIASQSGQRLDTNQEFVGQGVANIAAGLFSGYPSSGSFNRSALLYESGARSPMAAVFSGLVVLAAALFLGPLTAALPRPALSAMLLLAGYSMIDRRQIARIWRSERAEAAIMIVTLLATLFLTLSFAVLIGILMSLSAYILKTSTPQVRPVVPDPEYRYLTDQGSRPACPQLGVIDILGDLYFGAVTHVEDRIRAYAAANPSQRLLLLRMGHVDLCDLSGIRMLENVRKLYRERGGDLYLVAVREPVLARMRASGFAAALGGNILERYDAIGQLFYHTIDPAVCIYECPVRVFRECLSLPKPEHNIPLTLPAERLDYRPTPIEARALWDAVRATAPPTVIDVREPREFAAGHVPGARNVPLAYVLEIADIPHTERIVLVCRSGRRSQRAAAALADCGYRQLEVLSGGMLAWEAATLLEAVE